MENTSKALLISAGVLIAILLVAFGIKVLSSSGDNTEQAQEVGDAISLAGKDTTDRLGSIFDKIGANSGISKNKVVPDGAIYKQGAKTYNAGEEMPNETKSGDKYEYGDFTYELNNNGWNVKIKGDSRNKSNVGEILSNINGKPVVDMTGTFSYCTQLEKAPKIPNTVISMERTFMGCYKLNPAPSIPSSVTNMYYTFNNCYALEKAPAIPSGVINMDYTFYGCSSLQYLPTIPSGVINMDYTFYGCSSVKYNQSSGGTTKIPSTVTSMRYTFYNCTQLTGALLLNSIPSSYSKCLYGSQIQAVVGPADPNGRQYVFNTKR